MGSGVRGEKQNRLPDLLGFRYAFEGLQCEECLHMVLPGGGEHRGVDSGRGQGIDADVEGRKFRGHGLGEADDRSFGRRLVRRHRKSDQSGHRGEIDDRPATGLLQERNGRTDRVERAIEIDGDHPVEVFVADSL